jgi:predicted ABC-type exoprotein transport system permease subunit
MKKLTVLIIGLALSYPIYYFLAHNGNFIFKLLFGLVAGGAWFTVLSSLLALLKNKSYYSQISATFSQLVLVLSIILAIITYETFDSLTYGSKEQQTKLLDATKTFAIAKVTDIEHFSAKTIKRKEIPEYWEITYEFEDTKDKKYSGQYTSKLLPTLIVGDTLKVKYVANNPEINKQVNK